MDFFILCLGSLLLLVPLTFSVFYGLERRVKRALRSPFVVAARAHRAAIRLTSQFQHRMALQAGTVGLSKQRGGGDMQGSWPVVLCPGCNVPMSVKEVATDDRLNRPAA